MSTDFSAPNAHALQRQQHYLNSVFAAARGTAALKLDGQAPVFDRDLKAAQDARTGLGAIVAASKKQEQHPQPATHKAAAPHVGRGLSPVARVGLGAVADVAAHGMIAATLGPAAAGIYAVGSFARWAQGTMRAAGATPPAHQAATGGYHRAAQMKQARVMGAQRPSHNSFADEADHARGVAPKQSITPPQLKTAEHLLVRVNQQTSNLNRLLETRAMDAVAPHVVSDRTWAHLSFAEQSDMVRHNGRVSLEDTGTVSHSAVRRFTTRTHAPSHAQQMALTFH